MLQFTLPINKLTTKDVSRAGGKGASLGELTHAGAPVPPGFVVLAEAFEAFITETEIKAEIDAHLKKVKHKDMNSVDRASHEIRSIIKRTPVPKDIWEAITKAHTALGAKWVAVRSSATAEDSKVASWAGELETYLYVPKAKVLEMVKTCWSSLFTPRAIFYRFEKKLHHQSVSVAVVVQKMVDAEVAGVAFTVHPVTNDRNQMVIEAVWGLGESLVSGQVTPDTYVVDKKDNLILERSISNQKRLITQKKNGGSHFRPVPKAKTVIQKLSGKEVLALAKYCADIEKHYRHPQDIEWAKAKGKWYILQSRPITTLA